MLYSQLERVSEDQVRNAVRSYCEELQITGLETAELCGHRLEDIICAVTQRLILHTAKEERRSFKEAQSRGIKRAKERGVTLGRPKKSFPPGFENLYRTYKAGDITARECSKILDRTPSTFTYMMKKYEKEHF